MMNIDRIKKETIVCRVGRVVFHNKENGYSVLSVYVEGELIPVRICGTLYGRPAGTRLKCKGVWEEHPKYGRQFNVSVYDEITPSGDLIHYTTDIEVENVSGDLGDVYGDGYSIIVTAQAVITYNAVIDGFINELMTCTLDISTTICRNLPRGITLYDCLEFGMATELDVEGPVENISERSFKGLSRLDFYALGVPTSGEGLDEFDVAKAIKKALNKAEVKYDGGEVMCTEFFSKDELSWIL